MVLAVLAAATPAKADDDSPAARLAAVVHDRAEQDQQLRTALIAGVIVGGAVSLGVGIPVLVDGLSKPWTVNTGDEAEVLSGVILTALGGAALVSWPFAFLRTPLERLDTQIAAVQGTPEERLKKEEDILAGAASDERSNRKVAAALSFVTAALNVAIVPLDVTSGNQALAGLNGAAAFVGIIVGAIRLASPGPIEELWRTWLVGTGRRASRIHWMPTLTLGGGGIVATF